MVKSRNIVQEWFAKQYRCCGRHRPACPSLRYSGRRPHSSDTWERCDPTTGGRPRIEGEIARGLREIARGLRER